MATAVTRDTRIQAAIGPNAAWTLPAAGLLLGAPWIKPYFADSADAAIEVRSWAPFKPNELDTWARIATSDSYQLFSLTQVLGMICLLFGLFVLYGYLARGRSPRWALTALIFSVVGIVPVLMVLGELAHAAPILATFYQNGINICPNSLAEPAYLDRWRVLPQAFCKWWWGPAGSMPLAVTMIFFLWPASALSSAVAIWRSGLVSKWVALPFGLAYYLCVWISPIVTLIGGFLMVVAGGWIALQINREAAGRTSSHDALAAAQRT